jgi:hypothetical protein
MTRRICTSLAFLLLLPGAARADAPPLRKPVQVVQDRAALVRKLHSLGRSNHGGIDQARAESEGNSGFPTFTSSFSYGGTRYPFTMVGYPPSSGQSATIRPVIIPLRLDFVYFGAQGDVNVSFEPRHAVNNILQSPIFNAAPFANGTGQFGDMLQRATFWNKMDSRHSWHVQFSTPRVLPTIDVEVDPTIGDLFSVGGSYYGDIYIGALDSTLHTILQLVNVQPDELPVFVTYNASADVALGYHDAFVLGKNDGADVLQTLVYASWLEPSLFGDLLADISTLNHEVGEWLNDPYVNNAAPMWNFPNDTTCGDNPFLEVGDPQGNGPNYASFPVVPVKLNGYVYHLQDLVMLPWFAGETPSSAQNGWYDFPATNEIHAPFVPCSP